MNSVGAGPEGLGRKNIQKLDPGHMKKISPILNYESKLDDVMNENISLWLMNANIANLQ
jgi:hypothetical protein